MGFVCTVAGIAGSKLKKMYIGGAKNHKTRKTFVSSAYASVIWKNRRAAKSVKITADAFIEEENMEVAELAEQCGSLDLLAAYIMRTAGITQEQAEDKIVEVDFIIEQMLGEWYPKTRIFTCGYCGEEFEIDINDFDCGGEFHPDGEEILWWHIQLEHPDVFEDVKELETPDMIEECYEEDK